MDWLVKSFQQYPELAIFLTRALGHWVGRLKLGTFSLGSVTGCCSPGWTSAAFQLPRCG